MIFSNARRACLPLLLLGAAILGPTTQAAMLTSYERTAAATTGGGQTTALSVPGSTNYGNTFTGGADGGTLVAGTSYGFYDDYFFEITGGVANSITSTISLNGAAGLQISDLQARLFAYTGSGPAPLGPVVPAPILGWSTSFSGGSFTVIPDTALDAGRYVLQVRGTATGASGGSYSGVLNLTPVPLPAALPLLLAGLGLAGAAAKRRRPIAAA